MIEALDYDYGDVDWIPQRIIRALGAIGDKRAAPALVRKPASAYPVHIVFASIAALADMGAVEYAGDALDAALEFAKKGQDAGIANVARIAGASEVRKVVSVFGDPDLARPAVDFFCALIRRGDDGIALAREAGAVPALVEAISMRERVIISLLRILVGDEKAVCLIREAVSEGVLEKRECRLGT